MPSRPIIGDQTCEFARFHAISPTGYIDPNGHDIPKSTYLQHWGSCSNPECPEGGGCGGKCVASL